MLARQYRMPAVDLARFEVDPKIVKLIPADVALKHLVLPLKREGRTLTVAMADPTNLAVIDDLKFITRYDIFPVIAGEYTLRTRDREELRAGRRRSSTRSSRTWRRRARPPSWRSCSEEEEEQGCRRRRGDDAPVVKLINAILTDAVKRGASDIHIEPFEHELRVRYRIDGALPEVMKPPIKMKAALTSPHQDHVGAEHRRAARAAGRPHQAEDGQAG